MEEKLLQVAKDFFEQEVNSESKLGDFEEWDSLGQINFFMVIEEAFDKKFSPEEIMENTSIKDILKLLERKEK